MSGISCVRFALVLAASLSVFGAPARAQESELDPNWSEGGFALAAFDLAGSAITDEIVDLDEAPSGRVWGIGNVADAGSGRIGLIRRLGDGATDLDFGTGGQMTITPPMGYGLRAARIRIAPDGKPVFVGNAAGLAVSRGVLCRRFVAGNADAGFGDGAFMSGCSAPVTGLAGNADSLADFQWDAQGRIWAVGLSDADPVVNAIDYRLVVYRMSASGQLDADFSGDGMRVYDLDSDFGTGGPAGTAPRISIDSQGRILIGLGLRGSNSALAVVRLLDSGNYDSSFDGDGLLRVDPDRCPAPPCDDAFADLDVLANGDLLLTGNFQVQQVPSPLYAIGLVRLTGSGAAIPSFGDNGVVTDLFGDVFPSNHASASIESEDGRLLVVGWVGEVFALKSQAKSLGHDAAVLRFLPNGSPDPSFGAGGREWYAPLPHCPNCLAAEQRAVAVRWVQGRPLIAVAYGYNGAQDLDFAIMGLQRSMVFADGFEP